MSKIVFLNHKEKLTFKANKIFIAPTKESVLNQLQETSFIQFKINELGRTYMSNNSDKIVYGFIFHKFGSWKKRAKLKEYDNVDVIDSVDNEHWLVYVYQFSEDMLRENNLRLIQHSRNFEISPI